MREFRLTREIKTPNEGDGGDDFHLKDIANIGRPLLLLSVYSFRLSILQLVCKRSADWVCPFLCVLNLLHFAST